ncbi:uncharacterized protein prr14 [Syngnathus acus]|uniref:uncharacterized protein prr14 n=1 Tax=Syngnathus acus TaxID=161584 RepID=UPI001885AFF6|nr:uncharacterized protein prr14 [Syngnathus acus]
MLTLPSDSRPHLVFPMDGDAMPPHPFCSAPPHSEPPPPLLLPLPSITPSASDGTMGHNRSGQIQAIQAQGAQEEEEEETPSTYNPSFFKRHDNNTVQVSQSKQPSVENTLEDDKHKRDVCDFTSAAEFQNTDKDKRPLDRLDLLNRAADASVPAGWLTGPLFQSFKSKMASFTEIVMSPAKLFKDKNLSTPKAQLDQSVYPEPRENGEGDGNESSCTGSDPDRPRRLFSTSPLPSRQERSLLEEPPVKTADVMEEANVEKRPLFHSCTVQLEHLHCVSHRESGSVDAACHRTNSLSVPSGRTASARVRVERKRLKSEKDVAEAPPLKQKMPSTVSGGQEALKPAAKWRKAQGDQRSHGSRKRKSLVPQPSSCVHPQAAAATKSNGALAAGRGGPTKRAKKAAKTQAPLSTEALYFEMTPFEGNQSQCSQLNLNADGRLCHGALDEERLGSRSSRFSHFQAHNGTTSTAAGEIPPSAGQSVSSGRLLRSCSCPEIPSLFTSLPRQPPLALVPAHLPDSPRRARRHTVSSVEVEREIAPLCLRKEVFPSRRSFTCDGQNPPPALSPGSSLSALASCFLSSPLAFLSGKGEGRAAGPDAAVAAAASSSASSPTTDSSFGAREACAGSSGGSDGRTPSEDDDEDTGSSGHEFDEAAAALREEKSLSDSELKVPQNQQHHGKVSSIRIRRALPKPPNNLTPMGLPKAVRLKKKQFSLEEIYTNKNFNKVPESRLETVFEVPLSRRDGSESRFGQRRLKRFLKFHEVGEARKPKKVPPSGGKASSRTRRGGYARADPSLLPPPDADSLLCAKLKQLDLWLIDDQADGAC